MQMNMFRALSSFLERLPLIFLHFCGSLTGLLYFLISVMGSSLLIVLLLSCYVL